MVTNTNKHNNYGLRLFVNVSQGAVLALARWGGGQWGAQFQLEGRKYSSVRYRILCS